MPLPSLPADKANHLIYGLLISSATYAALLAGHQPPLLAARAGLAAAVVVGLLKELHDAWVNWRTTGNWRTGPHGVEGLDALATSAGGVPIWAALEALAIVGAAP